MLIIAQRTINLSRVIDDFFKMTLKYFNNEILELLRDFFY